MKSLINSCFDIFRIISSSMYILKNFMKMITIRKGIKEKKVEINVYFTDFVRTLSYCY